MIFYLNKAHCGELFLCNHKLNWEMRQVSFSCNPLRRICILHCWLKIKMRELRAARLQKKARLELESKTGKSVITSDNYLPAKKYKQIKGEPENDGNEK
jgi:hypothetical protein